MRTSLYAISILLMTSFIMYCPQSFASGVGPISGSSSVCAGSLTTLSDTTAGGIWTSGSSAIATVGTAGIVTGVSAGVVVITYTFGSFMATHAMTVNTAPVAGTISGGTSVCSGSTLTLSDSLGGGSWSGSLTSVAYVSSVERTEDISVEEVRSLNTFKEWDEERISELIRTIKAFSVVTYNGWSKARKFGKEIALVNDNQTEKLAA